MEPKLHPHPPRPSSSNPSSWGQRICIAIIALIATGIALYLGLYQWRIISHPWDPLFGEGTRRVLDSDLSHEITKWIRIPDAILGIFAYLSDAIFAMAGSKNRWYERPWLVILFGINVIPVGVVSMLLVLSQGFIVKSWCFLCLMSALISFILIILAYGEVAATCIYLKELYKRTDLKTTFWAYYGYPSTKSIEAASAALEIREKRNVAKNR